MTGRAAILVVALPAWATPALAQTAPATNPAAPPIRTELTVTPPAVPTVAPRAP